jgi:hypothetical protein
MSKQRGNLFERNNAFHLRFYVGASGARKLRSKKLCDKDELHFSKEAPAVVALAEAVIAAVNSDNQSTHRCPICSGVCKRTIKGQFASQV